MTKKQLWYKIKHLIPAIIPGWFEESGYLPLPKDERDFKLGHIFGGEEYKPQNQEVHIQTLSVKDQKLFNTCVFNSATVCKEVDEGVILSVRSLVAYAKRMGYLSGNGYSDLRSAQKALCNWGIEEEKDCPDGSFSERNDFAGYTNISLDQTKAAVHKTKTFWSISTKSDILKLLDQKRPLHFALPWYSGYNQSGGFCFPWLITNILGWFVGGHALACVGYSQNYNGRFVVEIQNSYSSLWGSKGKFYVDIDLFVKQINTAGYGCYVNLDLDQDTLTAYFLTKYNCKNVKKKNEPGIFYVQEGKKRAYLDWDTYLIWDYTGKNFSILSDAEAKILDTLPVGTNVDRITGLTQ